MEQYFAHTMAHSPGKQDGLKKWRSSSFESSEISPSSGFNCNICLEMVQDPVVTLCGHLYCWPCMYKWLHLQSISSEMSEQAEPPQCPVCKSEVSETTLVPLYGWDSDLKHSDEKKSADPSLCIPERPKGPSCGGAQKSLAASTTTAQLRSRGGRDVQPPYREEELSHYPPPYSGGGQTLSPLPQINGLPGSTTFHPVINMFGEMICARFFGNSLQPPFYANTGSYSVAATSDPRVRRRTVQADRYLSRLSFFLCCCLVLCLLLF